MSGYRESNFDPNAGGDYGPPLRPYNWVQWIGIVMIGVGTLFAVAFLLGEIGLIPKFLGKSPQPFTTFPLIGVVLVNSRRRPLSPTEDEQRRKNNRTALVVTAIVVPILLAAAAVDLIGAK